MRSMIYSVPMFLCGCIMEGRIGGTWPDKTPGDVEQPRQADCPIYDCSMKLVIPWEDLLACYGNGGNPPQWHMAPSPPPEVSQACDISAAFGDCEISIAKDGMSGVEDASCCTVGAKGDPAGDNCCFDAITDEHGNPHAPPELEAAFVSLHEDGELATGLQDALAEDCGASLSANLVAECSLQSGTPLGGILNEQDCPSEAAALVGDVDLVLDVDPTLSHLTLSLPSGTATVALSGTGAAASGPARFLVAIVDAQDATIGAETYRSFRFWFTHDILLNATSGQFTVPMAQGYNVDGRGQWDDGAWRNFTLEPRANAQGRIDVAGGSWYLDYASTFMGAGVLMHLEGALYATSTP